MATLILSTVGQAVGTAIGGPIGGVIGRTAGALAGQAIDQQIFGTTPPWKGRVSPISTCSPPPRARP